MKNPQTRFLHVLVIVGALFIGLGLLAALAYMVHTKGVISYEQFQSLDKHETLGTPHMPVIYCIMITGKDDARIKWAHLAIDNFLEQNYPNRRLIIVNHHPTHEVMHSMTQDHLDYTSITEMRVQKSGTIKLGHLRNVALELVPFDALWTPWDDDDIRRPDYLSILQKHLTPSFHAISFCNRLEVNISDITSAPSTPIAPFVWGVNLKPHGSVHILCRASDKRIRYLLHDTMEDVNLHRDLRSLGHQVIVLQDNDPTMYVRLVHGTNTSLYVDPKRTALKYAFEFEPSPQQKAYASNVAAKYKMILST